MQKEIQLLGYKVYQEASRSGVLPETLRNVILKKHEVYQMERGHIDSMGRNMVQRSLI